MDFQEAVNKATADMESAEKRLLDSGFADDQWTEIKKYIQASILRFQLTYARALTEAMDRPSQLSS